MKDAALTRFNRYKLPLAAIPAFSPAQCPQLNLSRPVARDMIPKERLFCGMNSQNLLVREAWPAFPQ